MEAGTGPVLSGDSGQELSWSGHVPHTKSVSRCVSDTRGSPGAMCKLRRCGGPAQSHLYMLPPPSSAVPGAGSLSLLAAHPPCLVTPSSFFQDTQPCSPASVPRLRNICCRRGPCMPQACSHGHSVLEQDGRGPLEIRYGRTPTGLMWAFP